MTDEEIEKLKKIYMNAPSVDLTDPENFRKMVIEYTADLEKNKKRVGIKHVNLKKNPRFKFI